MVAGVVGCTANGCTHVALVSAHALAPAQRALCHRARQKLTLVVEASVVGAGWGWGGVPMVAGVVGCTANGCTHVALVSALHFLQYREPNVADPC